MFKHRLDPPNPMVQIQCHIAPRDQTHCPQCTVVFLKKWLQFFGYALLQKGSETKKGTKKREACTSNCLEKEKKKSQSSEYFLISY